MLAYHSLLPLLIFQYLYLHKFCHSLLPLVPDHFLLYPLDISILITINPIISISTIDIIVSLFSSISIVTTKSSNDISICCTRNSICLFCSIDFICLWNIYNIMFPIFSINLYKYYKKASKDAKQK